MNDLNFFINATKIRNKSNALSPNHYHNYYELVYVTSGTFRYFIDNTIVLVSANDVILVNKNTIHKATLSPNNLCSYYIINFSESAISADSANMLHSLFTCCQLTLSKNSFYINMIFSEICNEYKNKEVAWENNIYYQLNELIIALYRLFSIQHTQIQKSFSMTEQAVKFVNECISNEKTSLLSLNSIAEKFHMCPSGFSKKFKRETGINYKKYVITAKIIYAQKLIETTDLSIGEVAYRSGFLDQNYFSTTFKKIAKISPSEYSAHIAKENLANKN